MTSPLIDAVRDRLGRELFQRVAGPEGPSRRDRIATAEGPRWFSDDRPIKRVHGDAAMLVMLIPGEDQAAYSFVRCEDIDEHMRACQ